MSLFLPNVSIWKMTECKVHSPWVRRAGNMNIETFLLCAKAFLSSLRTTPPVTTRPLLEFCSEAYTAHPGSAPASSSRIVQCVWFPFLCDGGGSDHG